MDHSQAPVVQVRADHPQVDLARPSSARAKPGSWRWQLAMAVGDGHGPVVLINQLGFGKGINSNWFDQPIGEFAFRLKASFKN